MHRNNKNFDDITLFDMTKDESSISLQAPNMSNSNFDDLDDDFDKLQNDNNEVLINRSQNENFVLQH